MHFEIFENCLRYKRENLEFCHVNGFHQISAENHTLQHT